jgi:hypothetical protein
MRNLILFLLNVLVPITLGASIYVGWRSTDLLVFRWIEWFGAGSLILRPDFALPSWVLYSLPDGCWVYACTSWMLLIWGRLVPWVWTGVVLAVGAELGQLVGLVPGTYDHLDMVFYVGAFLAAGVVYGQTHVVNGGPAGDGGFRVR